MILLLNLLIAFLAGVLADYILGRSGVADPVKLIVAVIVGILVFLLSPAAHF